LDLVELRVDRRLATADLLHDGDAQRQRDRAGGPLRPGDNASRYSDFHRQRVAVLVTLARRLADRAQEANIIRLPIKALFPKAHRRRAGPNDERRAIAVLREVGGGEFWLVRVWCRRGGPVVGERARRPTHRGAGGEQGRYRGRCRRPDSAPPRAAL